MSDLPLDPDDIRAAAAAHHELGPEYSDAVVEAFLDKADKQLAARIEARRSVAPSRNRGGPTRMTEHLPTPAGAAAAAAAVPLAGLLVLVCGSAAVRADWYQWFMGTSLLMIVIYLVATWAIKERSARVRTAR